MGNRLSKIYTRTGDDGTTGLGDGSRVTKDALRVEAYGTVDELNSAVGLLIACDAIPTAIEEMLVCIQHRLFDLGGELSIPTMIMVNEDASRQLEQWLDHLNEDLPPLKEFILPGGGQAAATCHLARSICRRAERRVISLATSESVNPPSIHYLNRLSDLLFVIARTLARHSEQGEVFWQHERHKK